MFLIYLTIGAVAGFSAGLLGIGGGVIVVPALASAFFYFSTVPSTVIMQMAIGTSLAAMIVTMLSATFAHARRYCVRWDLVRILLPGLISGTIVGALVAHHVSSTHLRIFFSLFLMVMAFRLIFIKLEESTGQQPSRFIMILIAGGIGILASILGAGGGVMLVPFMLRCGVNLREAAGTSVACGLGVGMAATISFMLLDTAVPELKYSTGYVYWPAFLGIMLTSFLFAPLGTALAHRLPVTLLKKILALFLFCIAIDMLLKK